MGSQSCCLRPEEKISEIKSGYIQGEIKEIREIDKGGFPQDSQQGYRAEANIQGGTEISNKSQISNQQIYNSQNEQQSKLGNANEAQIESKNQNENEPKDQNEEKNQNKEKNQNIKSQNAGNGENISGAAVKNNMEQQQQKEERREEHGEEQGEEQGEQLGEEYVEEEVEEIEEEVEELEPIEEGQMYDPINQLGETITQTYYLNGNNNNIQGQIINNENEKNQYINMDVNNANSYANNNEQNLAFINPTSQEMVDLNALQNMPIGGETGNIDINQYYQQGVAISGTNNIEITSSNPINEGNADINQYFQQSSDTGNGDLGNYVGISNALDSNNYVNQNQGTFDLNNLQGTSIENTYTVPTDNQGSNINYSGQEVTDYKTYGNAEITTNNVESSYANPSQSYSFNYSSQAQY